MSSTKWALAPVALFLAGCQTLLSFEPGSKAGTTSTSDDAAVEAASDASPPDAIVSPRDDAGVQVDAALDGSIHGPPMVYVVADVATGGGYLVDSTEVSRGQFAEYLRATSGGTTGIDPSRPAACANKTSFGPGNSAECGFAQGGLELDPLLPMSCVDWCTAWSFCRWAGKRLCGAQGTGATVPLDRGDDVTVSEWYLACATSDRRRFPYGDSYEPGSCATESNVAHGVGLATCAPNETGPFDMSGNVGEWENGCSDDGTSCAVRGGDYASPSTAVECGVKRTLAPEAFMPTLGFRCCADAVINMPVVDGGEL